MEVAFVATIVIYVASSVLLIQFCALLKKDCGILDSVRADGYFVSSWCRNKVREKKGIKFDVTPRGISTSTYEGQTVDCNFEYEAQKIDDGIGNAGKV